MYRYYISNEKQYFSQCLCIHITNYKQGGMTEKYFDT